ncbi:M20/M25/M40 family metallo-hydrolase [Agromyces sp. SYSU K20354]|uniref:M20/M25/M40 family metallo-hydrolase n=1 Tax=Agromyces cavernae TaxID=2898659 RepID=UPI001E59031A|nr:M20/M25/M40 family metallo-hydrolase [Agromyces cavernae]MCD2441955.1 M20/M25/M40 family metallo-hydrolase [Agromyces cavernae]
MNHRTRTTMRAGALLVAAAVCGAVAIAVPAQAAVATDTSALRAAVTVEGVTQHLAEFQAIADANNDNRAAGTSGHDASVDYVEGLLDAAGYITTRQEFSYERTDFGDSTLEQIGPNPAVYVLGVDYFPMDFSGEGDTTASVTAVDVNLVGDRASTSGCEAADFAGFPAGDIALIQRGSCDFSVKADNAAAVGATGVIVFNQGNDVPGDDRFGLFGGTLGEPVRDIPVVSAPFALGEEWATTPGLQMRLNLEAEVVQVTTENLLADTPTGRTDRTVVVGGHLDGVAEGPGINDNGSGTAAILETALAMADLEIDPENRVRFAFWSGEEDGLIGSSFYVSQLTPAEIKGTALNLNFDMVGSLNSVNFVYDGDGDALGTAGPNGSAVIEDVFVDFFDSQDEPSAPTDFDGRSDYFGFIEAGIPAGGLFTGAEGIKTEEQAEIFGGTAGEPYDPCYHAACDTFDNINDETLDLMADAIAHSTLTFAETTSAVNGTAKGNGKGVQFDPAFKGHQALR